LATRDRPDVGRWHRATSLYLRKAKLFAVNMFPAGACFPCLRFLLPKRRLLTKLFSLFDANLKNTVSLRSKGSRTMDEKGAHSALMRGLKDPFACTVLVARQRRVKLTLELSFLRRASRWSAPSAKPRRRVSGTPTRMIKANRSATFATCDRYVTRVDPTRQYFIIFVLSQPDPNTRGALFHSSLSAVASALVAVRMGQIQAN